MSEFPDCSEEVKKKWCDLYEQVEEWEKTHHKAPEITVLGVHYPNLMMERTTCMAKEIAKLGCSCNLQYLPDNQHIMEEMELLKKDMDLLRHDLKIQRERRTWEKP